ncbi:MAG: SRPBCC family protein [Anaerolineae bacterium]|nr:SRPBCC family protein [Anaerolineae bacterium]
MGKLNLVAEPGTYEIRMWRDFDAPRERVFKAYTDPTLIPKWWGPKIYTTIVEKMDVKPGGLWRYVQRDADGNEFAFYGVYHDIVSPERIISTFEFAGMPGHVLLSTLTLEEVDGKTRVTDSSVFQTVADRDGMLQSGMEEGATEGWDRFEALLRTM